MPHLTGIEEVEQAPILHNKLHKTMLPSLIKPAIPTSRRPLTLCTLAFLLSLCILAFYALYHPHQNPQTTLHLFLSLSSNSTISSYLRSLTLHPHLSGTRPSVSTSNYVRSNLNQLPTHSLTYRPLLSYPAHSSLSAHFSNGSSISFSLNSEKPAEEADIVAPYHAYSPSGSARAEVVFVNFGREIDYHTLDSLGVNVSGRVVLARRGAGMGRGGAVRIAETKGAVAVLLYTEWDKEKRNREEFMGGVERGTVMTGVGDPLTPGWAAVEGGEKLGLEDPLVSGRFPGIPSMPLSFGDADVILRSLGGPLVPLQWGDSGGGAPRRVGPGPTLVNLTYQGEERVAEIQNIFAVIRGSEEPDRYVILGNHRDAWTYGAVDPNSGTAALLDIARRFTHLVRTGWKPRRTIILCSWDAEEFGMVGSTEWVEQNLVNLGAKAVAYLNVDCAVQGPGFFAGATPQLDNLILEVTKKVKDPDLDGETIYGNWAASNQNTRIQRLSGVDSDFAPFLQHAGVPSVDIYYGTDFPVYHTAFDSYDWITKNADPWFHRHVAVANIWGLIALHLADESILPFDYLSYAKQLQKHKDDLSKSLDQSISLHPLVSAIEKLVSASKQAGEEAQRLREQESRGNFVAYKLRALNDRLMLAERGFLDADGLQGREWFKHLIYGPSGENDGRKMEFFPGIADAISGSKGRRPHEDEEGAAAIRHEIWRVARAIERAATALSGELA